MGCMGGWQPVLDGADAEAARDAISAVAEDLAGVTDPDPSLSTGQAGMALLHAYRALDGVDGAADAAVDAIGRALDGMVDGAALPWLYVGFSGVAWAAHHIAPVIGEVDGLDGIDDMVAAAVDRPDWPFEYELVVGLAGLGVYGLARAPLPAADRIVHRVVAHLASTAERSAAGISWRTHTLKHLRTDQERASNTDGYHVLGLAHGVAGAIGVLAGVCARPGAPAQARELLAGSVPWLLAQSRPQGHPRQGALVGRDLEVRGAVDGWCYGDAGTAAVLLGAGLAAGEPAWVEAAHQLARHSARIGTEDGPPDLDLSLCHGTLGRAHIFNRIGQRLGDAQLVDAARAGYRETLRQRGDVGVGGLSTPNATNGGPSPGFQMGSAGVALGLLAAVSPVEPAWDSVLLLSPPPGGTGDD